MITITDVRRVFCVQGVRRWAESNGIDFKDFIQNGIRESDLRSKCPNDSALIDRVIAAKEAAENGIVR